VHDADQLTPRNGDLVSVGDPLAHDATGGYSACHANPSSSDCWTLDDPKMLTKVVALLSNGRTAQLFTRSWTVNAPRR
jgi:hypothetical protein